MAVYFVSASMSRAWSQCSAQRTAGSPLRPDVAVMERRFHVHHSRNNRNGLFARGACGQ